MQQNKVSAGEFGFKLASSGSELYLGGTDSKLYTGSIEYHSVDRSTGFWQLSGASAYVGSKAAVSNFETIIDSGTTIMYGPPSAVKILTPCEISSMASTQRPSRVPRSELAS